MSRHERRESKYRTKDITNHGRKSFHLKPLNQKQKEYISLVKAKQVTLAFGPAGTSKTFCPSVIAAELFANRDIDKIIVVRPYEGCGRSIGLLPGTANEKLAPICQPVMDVFNRLLGKSAVECALSNGQIVMQALEFVRGMTFDNCFVILDEAQNIDVTSIKALMTRVGENCKIVCAGDVSQKDIRGDSGLAWLIDLAKRADLDVGIVEFGVEHIVRSGFVKDFIIAVERYGL